MAGTDRTTLIEPERRFAELFAKRKDLSPPVPVEKVLERYADIERAAIPAGDAVMLRRNGQRPLVIVNDSQRGNRLRFTLAHELGHIVLPWQVGTAFCHPEGTFIASGDFHIELETQANRFATELLIPRAWLVDQLGDSSERLAARIIEIANKAEVSPITLSIALGTVCPFPAAACITNVSGEPQYQTRSESCRIRQELRWWESPSLCDELESDITSAKFGDYALHTIVLPRSLRASTRVPKNSSIELLDKILSKVPTSEVLTLRGQVAGVVGFANNYPEAHRSVEALHSLLKQRFLGKSSLSVVTKHRLFPQFLEAKAYELFQRRHPVASAKEKARRSRIR